MKPAVAVGALLLVAACASAKVESSVTVFHRIDPARTYSYAFVPMKSQEQSLEYAAYKEYVRSALGRLGWREAPARDADALLAFDYGVDNAVVVGNEAVFRRKMEMVAGFREVAGREGSDRLFESKLVSIGSTSHLAGIMKCLVDSMFIGFPGTSGEMRKVSVDPATCASEGRAK